MSSNLNIALQAMMPKGLSGYRDVAANVRQKQEEIENLDVLEGRFLAAADKLIEKYDGHPDMLDHFSAAMERVSLAHEALCQKRDTVQGNLDRDRKLYPHAFS